MKIFQHFSPYNGLQWEKSWNVFIKNLNFFSTEERMTLISWMTWGCVNSQQKFFFFKFSELLL